MGITEVKRGSMKTLIKALAAVLLLVWLGSKLGGNDEPAPPAPAAAASPVAPAPEANESTELDKARKDVEARFKGSRDEPTSKDAVWTADDVFKVGVIDDGTDRSGYAEYVCNVLYDYGFKEKKVWVQVIDIVKLTRTNKWEKLGEAHCL